MDTGQGERQWAAPCCPRAEDLAFASNSNFEFEFRRAIAENGKSSNKTGMKKGKQ
jgi:hypothetical protein